MRSPGSSTPPRLSTAPAAGELEQRSEVIGTRELLADVPHRLHVRTVQEYPLVRRRPGNEEPTAVRRPGDVAEDARAGEEQPRRPRMVDVHELHLAVARQADRDRELMRAGPERTLQEFRAEQRDRAPHLTAAAEDDYAPRGDHRKLASVGRPLKARRQHAHRGAPD